MVYSAPVESTKDVPFPPGQASGSGSAVTEVPGGSVTDEVGSFTGTEDDESAGGASGSPIIASREPVAALRRTGGRMKKQVPPEYDTAVHCPFKSHDLMHAPRLGWRADR